MALSLACIVASNCGFAAPVSSKPPKPTEEVVEQAGKTPTGYDADLQAGYSYATVPNNGKSSAGYRSVLPLTRKHKARLPFVLTT